MWKACKTFRFASRSVSWIPGASNRTLVLQMASVLESFGWSVLLLSLDWPVTLPLSPTDPFAPAGQSGSVQRFARSDHGRIPINRNRRLVFQVKPSAEYAQMPSITDHDGAKMIAKLTKVIPTVPRP